MNKKYAYAFAALMIGLTACSNEDLTSPSENQVAGKTVHVTLTVNRPSDNTRTVVDENEDGVSLYSHWVSGDKLLVVNSSNQKVGDLTIVEGMDSSEGVFSGNATLNTTDKYTLVYLGGSNDNGGAYATWTNGTGISNPVATPPETGFKVSGAKADLCRADLMKKDDVQFLISGENAYPAENVALDVVNAMSHFTLTGIPGVLDNEAVLTVNYGDVTHTISNITSELYLPMPTGSYILSFSLVNGNDSYTASINGGNEVTVTPLYYVDTDDTTGHGKGIEVVLVKEETLAEGVGPVIEYGGKRWRFTRGNLKYTLSTDTWTVLDDQTQFVNAAGLGLGESTKSLKGTTKDDIGLFPWGATGVEDAQKPWTLLFDESTQKGVGSYWPSSLGASKNSTIQTLLNADADYVYDFGHAYMSKGRLKIDVREYITPPSEAFDALMQNCFVQGATVNGVKGLLCIPGQFTLAEVKEFIKSVDGAACLSTMVNVIHDNQGNTLNYKYITITDYEALKKLNDAVFFPAASKRNLNSGKVYSSDKQGAYWSAKGSSSGGTNAVDLWFDGEVGGFFYSGTKSTSSHLSRDQQLAVRLLVEVLDEE